jgi:Rieske Fe-S protein
MKDQDNENNAQDACPQGCACMNRRQFMLLSAAAAAACCQPVTGFAKAPAGERVLDAGPVRDYSAPGVYTRYRDQGFFVIRQGAKLFALSAVCTHRKCKVSAEDDRTFSCDCHGSTFDPGGKVTEGPAKRDLPVLSSLTNEQGHLIVKVPQG